MEVLQYATEAFTVDYLADLLCLASHAKRQTIKLEDSAVWKRLCTSKMSRTFVKG